MLVHIHETKRHTIKTLYPFSSFDSLSTNVKHATKIYTCTGNQSNNNRATCTCTCCIDGQRQYKKGSQLTESLLCRLRISSQRYLKLGLDTVRYPVSEDVILSSTIKDDNFIIIIYLDYWASEARPTLASYTWISLFVSYVARLKQTKLMLFALLK